MDLVRYTDKTGCVNFLDLDDISYGYDGGSGDFVYRTKGSNSGLIVGLNAQRIIQALVYKSRLLPKIHERSEYNNADKRSV